MTKKYELTNVTINHNGITLYRIKRLSDGLIGGYVGSENNLSQSGDCFIYDQAKVSGYARVSGSARVFGSAEVSGSAVVFGSARVSGSAEVSGSAVVYDSARVFGSAEVYGYARVSGSARVFGSAVATKLVQNVITGKHNITITDNNVIIGCENHTIDYWKKSLKDIGIKHGYTAEERNAIRHILKGLLMLRESK